MNSILIINLMITRINKFFTFVIFPKNITRSLVAYYENIC